MDALPQAPVDPLPLLGRDQTRHEVEREDLLLAAVIPVDVERDAHVHQIALGGALPSLEVPLGEGVDPVHEEAEPAARRAIGMEYLVVESFRVVGVEIHLSDRRVCRQHAHRGAPYYQKSTGTLPS